MKLFFRQTGETGPAIVILHGIFGSSDNWLTISKTIAARGYRVFALDQRNHGQSPAPMNRIIRVWPPICGSFLSTTP